MEKRFEEMTMHQKLEAVIREMIEKEVLYKDARKEFEKIYIETASKKFKGNKSKIAKFLGIHRNTVQSRAKTLKIKRG